MPNLSGTYETGVFLRRFGPMFQVRHTSVTENILVSMSAWQNLAWAAAIIWGAEGKVAIIHIYAAAAASNMKIWSTLEVDDWILQLLGALPFGSKILNYK